MRVEGGEDAIPPSGRLQVTAGTMHVTTPTFLLWYQTYRGYLGLGAIRVRGVPKFNGPRYVWGCGYPSSTHTSRRPPRARRHRYQCGGARPRRWKYQWGGRSWSPTPRPGTSTPAGAHHGRRPPRPYRRGRSSGGGFRNPPVGSGSPGGRGGRVITSEFCIPLEPGRKEGGGGGGHALYPPGRLQAGTTHVTAPTFLLWYHTYRAYLGLGAIRVRGVPEI